MNATPPIDALGLAAGALTTIAFVPQIVRIVRLRHADDLSWWTFAALVAGSALWLAYGAAIGAPPVVLANLVTLVLLFVILVLKWRFRAR